MPGITEQTSVIFVVKANLPQNILILPGLKLPTPVKVNRLAFLLDRYNHSAAAFISYGFHQGFHVHYVTPYESSSATNLASALANPKAVDANIQKELSADRLPGPFQRPPFAPFRSGS